jgi:hypothetical protein
VCNSHSGGLLVNILGPELCRPKPSALFHLTNIFMSAPDTILAPPAPQPPTKKKKFGVIRAIGLGLITGAADDDPSAIGTYASAGAKLGPSFLWTAPLTFPMMVAVVYLSAKLGQVTGEGLFAVIRKNYPRWFLYAVLLGVLIGIPSKPVPIWAEWPPRCIYSFLCRLRSFP